MKARLAAARLHALNQRAGPDGASTLLYLAARGPTPSESLAGGTPYLVELTLAPGSGSVKVVAKTRAGAAVARFVALGVAAMLK